MKIFYTANEDEMDVDENNNPQDKDIRKNLAFKEFILQSCLAFVKEVQWRCLNEILELTLM